MPKAQPHSGQGSTQRQNLPFFFVILISLVFSSFSLTRVNPGTSGNANVIRVETVTFEASDGLEVTADEYIIPGSNPYILLLHEQQSSRGEFKTIARKLCKLDYNCLAVDLRNGGNNNFVSNLTTKQCRVMDCPTGAEDISRDIEAAIQYAYEKSGQPVTLFGSSANGSLSLLVGKESEFVRAIVAFSPGEYFQPQIQVEESIRGTRKPVFVTSSRMELPYVRQLVSGINDDYLTLYEPELGEGARGTATLTTENPNNSEYWLALMLFFKELI